MIRVFKRQENNLQFVMDNKLQFVEINLLYGPSRMEYQFIVKSLKEEGWFVEHSHGEVRVI